MTIELLATLEVDMALRDRFRSGGLPIEWQAKYPDIFDDDDLRLAVSQPNNHFYEWAGAIHLYEKRGYLSLLEKYQFKNHKRKASILQKLDFEELRKALEYQKLKKSMQVPDLLAYKPDFLIGSSAKSKAGEIGYEKNKSNISRLFRQYQVGLFI